MVAFVAERKGQKVPRAAVPLVLAGLMVLGTVAGVFSGSTEAALARRRALDVPSLPPANISGPYEWLHIPKTGTSWGNTMVLWACPELEPQVWVGPVGTTPELPASCKSKFRLLEGWWPWGGLGSHHTLHQRSDEELRKVFTMLRHPRTRAASAFHFFTNYTRPGATEEEICAEVDRYVHTHGFSSRGSLAKIIAGVPADIWKPQRFLTKAPPSDAQVQEACRRLGLFAFVGISDHWRASVCLFHAMYGGQIHEVEYHNVRRGKYAGGALKEVNCGNPADERVFDCAMEVFTANLRRYPHCSKEVTR